MISYGGHNLYIYNITNGKLHRSVCYSNNVTKYFDSTIVDWTLYNNDPNYDPYRVFLEYPSSYNSSTYIILIVFGTLLLVTSVCTGLCCVWCDSLCVKLNFILLYH